MKKTHLFIVDPQNDFCTPISKGENPNASFSGGNRTWNPCRKGALLVPGADEDMRRLAGFIDKHQKRITDIHCTLDSHQAVHIAHPTFWVDSHGNHPGPFTIITAQDVKNGTWRSFNPRWQGVAENYVNSLEKNKRYVLCIWPIHCLIGSWGHSVVEEVSDALYRWEYDTFNRVNYVTKGSNMLTEHYSGVIADVPDDNDISTKLNTRLLDVLTKADEIIITGEALSHCVANTITDIADNFGEENVKKFVLLEDTSSNVPGFEKLGQDFVQNMVKRGMRVSNTKDY